MNPGDIRFTQRSAGGGRPPRTPGMRQDLADGWNPDYGPVDVIQTPDGLLSIDNTRIAVAQELGLPRVTARLRGADELLPDSFPAPRLESFRRKAARLGLSEPRTWGDIFDIRLQDNRLGPTGRAQRPRLRE